MKQLLLLDFKWLNRNLKRTLISFFFVVTTSSLYSQHLTEKFVDNFTATSCYLEGSRKGHLLWSGTGFFVKVNTKYFLITNNHIVGGEFYINEYKELHKNKYPSKDSFPDSLKVRLYDKVLYSYRVLSIPLLTKENSNWIKFWENEINKQNLLDVVAIPLTYSDVNNFGSTTILDSSYLQPYLILNPSSELNVVGFPFGFGGTANLYPVWKRGTIASEPNLISTGISTFLIDATTRAGMSGSPVFFRGTNYVVYDPTERENAITEGPLSTFLIGIYSAQNPSLELGSVTRLDKVFAKLSKFP